MVWLAMPVMVGIEFTVNVNVRIADPPLESVTVMVIVLVPDWPARGVTVTFAVVPVWLENVMFAFGTRPVFDELPESVRGAAPLNVMPKVVDPFVLIERSEMALSVGPGLTVNVDVAAPPSGLVIVTVRAPVVAPLPTVMSKLACAESVTVSGLRVMPVGEVIATVAPVCEVRAEDGNRRQR